MGYMDDLDKFINSKLYKLSGGRSPNGKLSDNVGVNAYAPGWDANPFAKYPRTAKDQMAYPMPLYDQPQPAYVNQFGPADQPSISENVRAVRAMYPNAQVDQNGNPYVPTEDVLARRDQGPQFQQDASRFGPTRADVPDATLNTPYGSLYRHGQPPVAAQTVLASTGIPQARTLNPFSGKYENSKNYDFGDSKAAKYNADLVAMRAKTDELARGGAKASKNERDADLKGLPKQVKAQIIMARDKLADDAKTGESVRGYADKKDARDVAAGIEQSKLSGKVADAQMAGIDRTVKLAEQEVGIKKYIADLQLKSNELEARQRSDADNAKLIQYSNDNALKLYELSTTQSEKQRDRFAALSQEHLKEFDTISTEIQQSANFKTFRSSLSTAADGGFDSLSDFVSKNMGLKPEMLGVTKTAWSKLDKTGKRNYQTFIVNTFLNKTRDNLMSSREADIVSEVNRRKSAKNYYTPEDQ